MEEVEGGQHAGGDDGALAHHAERDERARRDARVPRHEETEDEHPQHEHGDERPVLPSPAVLRARQRQRDQRQAQADDQQERAEEVELGPEEVVEALGQGGGGGVVQAAALQPVLLGAPLQDEHGQDEGQGAEGEDHGPHAVAPAPGRVLQHALADDGAEIEGGDGRDGFGQRRPQAAVEEARRVGDEDLLHDGVARVAD